MIIVFKKHFRLICTLMYIHLYDSTSFIIVHGKMKELYNHYFDQFSIINYIFEIEYKLFIVRTEKWSQ